MLSTQLRQFLTVFSRHGCRNKAKHWLSPRETCRAHFHTASPLGTTIQTVQDVINNFSVMVGATKNYADEIDRSFLKDMIPKSQDELPPRTMSDSFDRAIIPLSSSLRLRHRYVNYRGGIRVGRLLEDLDIFSVWLCYKYIKNPHQKEGLPSPYSIVTALVDNINFKRGIEMQLDKDVLLEGQVTYVGRTSMETTVFVKQLIDGEFQEVTKAVFMMVARDPLNQGSAIVNPLICETEEDKALYEQGCINQLSRKRVGEQSLFLVPPSETEKTLVHNMFMEMADSQEYSFAPKKFPEGDTWMAGTKLKNLIMCHPEHRNRFKKIFGGFLMRQAMELSWACASMYCKGTPYVINIDDILFKRPVEIGSLLYLNAQIVYTEDNHMQVSCKANVMDIATQKSQLTNIFHFTYETSSAVSCVRPRTYAEAMMFLDGRRHYQNVMGVRKFYGQGETVEDTLIS